jgi:hypothetical protein
LRDCTYLLVSRRFNPADENLAVAHGNDPDIAGLGFSKDRNIGVTQADQDRNGGLRVA